MDQEDCKETAAKGKFQEQDFESILEEIGGFGIYQVRFFIWFFP